MTRTKICQLLQEMAEPRVRDFAASLIPGAGGSILGVRIPRLRALAKKLAREDWLPLFDSLLEAEWMEELLLCGMLPGYAPCVPLEVRLEAIRRYTPRITNWSLCDTCCATYHFARRNQLQVWQFLQPYLQSQEEFPARFGVVMLLGHFVRDAEWAPAVAAVLPTVPAKGFYAEMALGWCLCELHIHHPEAAAPLLEESTSPLRPTVLAMAQRKIRESRRCH